MTISREEYDRLLGAIDALKRAVIEVARQLPMDARDTIASEIDAYGSSIIFGKDAETSALSATARQAFQDTAWDIATPIWPQNERNR